MDYTEEQGALLARLADELEGCQREHVVIGFEARVPALYAVCALVQLAMRHPGLTADDPSYGIGWEFVEGTIAKLRAAGLEATADALEAGNDPANDYVATTRAAVH